MTAPARLTYIPPTGRRANIIRAAATEFVSMSEVVREVRLRLRAPTSADLDPAVDRIKTTNAVRDLRRRGLIARTAWGYRATAAGLDLLRRSEPSRCAD